MIQSSSVGAARLFWVTPSVSRPPLLVQVQIQTEADRPGVRASAPVQPAAALLLFFRLVPLIDASVHRTWTCHTVSCQSTHLRTKISCFYRFIYTPARQTRYNTWIRKFWRCWKMFFFFRFCSFYTEGTKMKLSFPFQTCELGRTKVW